MKDSEQKKSVTVCLEHRFYCHSGRLYTKLAFPYAYWKDYLNYFDKVTIVARVQNISQLSPEMTRVDGEQIYFAPMPYYIGPRSFLKKLPSLMSRSIFLSKNNSHFILRSGNISNIIWPALILFRRPYLREYPGNIMEGIIGYAGESIKTKTIAAIADFAARLQGRFSKANSFVSKYCCELYSSKKPSFIFSSFSFSEITLSKLDYTTNSGLIISSVGRLEKEKGHESLIVAASRVSSCGLKKIHINFVGDGSQKENLVALAKELGMSCTFYGAVTDRKKLFNIMLDSDLFVIPSLTEGMPRALLEAMALGLPCIGSRVGGIPEVLSDEFMFTPGNPDSIEKSITRIIDSLCSMQTIGTNNRKFIAEHYGEEKLLQCKISFWRKLYE